ncbi:Protein of unknown function [Mesorhizobium albiziae]|uniref:DUF1236 domain-containing protein n=1 Tax=Neomesorhizobium albiziae TaxID=335020 RepID=A0A1I4B1T8_9HYPH|nr:DUF1236 domain-containing protein [Mesorhizobium albiziae]GLS34277.1 hypothetical protein GCM10007937_59920 [Mesorhizobium albiziae]SFK62872.1 Protein of unknown function [Mesorhizobium albiziae]
MKIRLSAASAGLVLLAGIGTAAAQEVLIVPEQETVIREYVVKHPVDPVELPPGVEITVGTPLPDVVELYPIDEPDVQYRYVIVDGRTVLVEPETRKIVRVLE